MGTTRRSAVAVAAFLLALPCPLAACGHDPAGPRATVAVPAQDEPASGVYASARWGYSVRIPPGWYRAKRPLTALTDPVETLVVGTYRPRSGSEDCGPLALAGFDAKQALVIVLERGLDPNSDWPDFPPRPAHFVYEPGHTSAFSECLSTTEGIPLKDHWFRFTDAGRHFHVLVVVGADAPPSAEAEAYRLLDSLHFDPSVKPGWRSSG